jgi:hypothetical protein
VALYKVIRTSILEGPAGAFSDDPLEPAVPAEMMTTLNAAVVEKQIAHHHLGHLPGHDFPVPGMDDCDHDEDDAELVREFKDAATGSPYEVLVVDEITAYQFAPTEVVCHGCKGTHRLHNEWSSVAKAAGNSSHEFMPCCSGDGSHHYDH